KYDAAAHRVYPKAEMTEGIDEFGEFLIEKGFLLGLVSSSRKNWIDLVIPRLSFGEKFETIISVNDDPDLQSKPAPDGYKKAMELIGTTPENTIILEDSNTGIEAGQTSGALTIGLRQNLPEGYVQKGADLYAENLESLKKILSVF
ncbi:MAG TPA: HAD family phosphatase, partial [Candidatus Dojkabacteria bacterium]